MKTRSALALIAGIVFCSNAVWLFNYGLGLLYIDRKPMPFVLYWPWSSQATMIFYRLAPLVWLAPWSASLNSNTGGQFLLYEIAGAVYLAAAVLLYMEGGKYKHFSGIVCWINGLLLAIKILMISFTRHQNPWWQWDALIIHPILIVSYCYLGLKLGGLSIFKKHNQLQMLGALEN